MSANFRQPPNAGGAEAVIVSKNITANGTYNASSDSADGYNPVTVNVPGVIPVNITPSNSSPEELTANTAVNPTVNGYAISSYSAVTPSDILPVSINAGDIIKSLASGYLYGSNSLGKCKVGTFLTSTTAQTISLGFRPKYLVTISGNKIINVYDYDYNDTQAYYMASSTYPILYTFSGNTANNHIGGITEDGFVFNRSGTGGDTGYYFAIG